jgi:hypothetical protein
MLVHTFSLGVLDELFQAVNKVGPIERVTSDPNTCGLAQPYLSRLKHLHPQLALNLSVHILQDELSCRQQHAREPFMPGSENLLLSSQSGTQRL